MDNSIKAKIKEKLVEIAWKHWTTGSDIIDVRSIFEEFLKNDELASSCYESINFGPLWDTIEKTFEKFKAPARFANFEEFESYIDQCHTQITMRGSIND